MFLYVLVCFCWVGLRRVLYVVDGEVICKTKKTSGKLLINLHRRRNPPMGHMDVLSHQLNGFEVVSAREVPSEKTLNGEKHFKHL